MARDLAACGIGSKAAFDGVYQHPSSWILDTVYALLTCEAGVMAATSKGGYCSGTGRPAYRNQEHRFNLVETWMLCA
eukprot:5047651-Amphidinium_carterae.1